MYTRSTPTPTTVLSAQVQTHILVSKASKSFTGGGNRKPRLLLQLHRRYMRVRNDCTGPFHFDQTTEHTFLFSQIKEPPRREETGSSGLRGTYTITIFLQSAWVPVCAFRGTATFVFLNQTSNRPSQTHGSAFQRLAHEHAKRQFAQRRQN